MLTEFIASILRYDKLYGLKYFFLSHIGDVNDFSSADKLASYFGIVPRVSNSNETEKTGRITKRGNKLARTTLVQCTLVAIRYSNYLGDFYRKST